MKCLIVLLACVFAANATSYILPEYCSYEYFCQHNFYVYPEVGCYCFDVYFPHCWTESEYYEDIFEVYPGDDCDSHCFTETPVDDIISYLDGLLANARVGMTQELNSHKADFEAHIDEVHQAYKDAYSTYLNQFASYSCQHILPDGTIVVGDYNIDVDGKIQEYCSTLSTKKTEVMANYDQAVIDIISSVASYHDSLLANARSTLETRLEKIAEYDVLVDQQIDQFVDAFIEQNAATLAYVQQYIISMMTNLCISDEEVAYLDYYITSSAQNYYNDEYAEIVFLSGTYRHELENIKRALMSAYTCSYKCYFTTGCLTFFEDNYQSQCECLGCWYETETKYDAKLGCVPPVYFVFEPCEPEVVITCDVDTVVGDIAGTIAEIEAQRDANIATMQQNFADFISTWEGYHAEYKAAFEAIVQERHDFLVQYREQQLGLYECDIYTVAEIDQIIADLIADLAALAEEVCAEYNSELDARLAEAQSLHDDFIADYRTCVADLISNVQTAFDECVACRDEAIQLNLDELYAARDTQRSDLYDALYEAKWDHVDEYNNLVLFYSCTEYFTGWDDGFYYCYLPVLDDRIDAVMADFDAYWASLIDQLSQSFQCGYSCQAEFCLPELEIVPCWTYELPCAASYSYQYGCYCQYYLA